MKYKHKQQSFAIRSYLRHVLFDGFFTAHKHWRIPSTTIACARGCVYFGVLVGSRYNCGYNCDESTMGSMNV